MKVRYKVSYIELDDDASEFVVGFLEEHKLPHVVSGNTVKVTADMNQLLSMDVPKVVDLLKQRGEPNGELNMSLMMFLGYDCVVNYGFYQGWSGVDLIL